MSKITQKEQVIQQLKRFGKVSRNWALQNYMSRLGAIMNELKKEGWEFDGDFVKTDFGKDYVYVLKDSKEKQGKFF